MDTNRSNYPTGNHVTDFHSVGRQLERKKFLRRICLILFVILGPVLSGNVTSAAQKSASYKYTADDGTVLFTDIKVSKQQLDSGAISLQEVASGQAGRRSYQGSYGRPQATASCKDLDRQALAQRAAVIDPLIRRFADKYSMDPHLIKAIARIESCFDPRALSSAGAQGAMQLMPLTAAQYGSIDPYNLEQNVATGIRYFAEMFKRYQQDTRLALAAYNAGPTAVDKHNGIPPYPETQNYVRKVLKKYREYSAIPIANQ